MFIVFKVGLWFDLFGLCIYLKCWAGNGVHGRIPSHVGLGRFERNKGLKYVRGEIHVVKGIDPDFWSFLEILGIPKEFKYAIDVKLWWKGLKQNLLSNIKLLSDDKEALALAKYAEDRNKEVNIYVQYVPCQSEVVHFIVGAGMDEELGQAEVGDEVEVRGEGDVVGEAELGRGRTGG